MSPIKYTIAFCFVIVLIGVKVAVAEEEEGVGYDSLVKELSNPPVARSTMNLDPFDHVKIHIGVATVATSMGLPKPNGGVEYSSPKGFQASLGIDLFTPVWQAEGVVRSYSAAKGQNSSISLHEFDLRLNYIHPLGGTPVRLRTGIGLASRYVDFRWEEEVELPGESKPSPVTKSTAVHEQNYSTPASIVFVGLETLFNSYISVGGELSFRSALIEETIDKQALDLALRFDVHF